MRMVWALALAWALLAACASDDEGNATADVPVVDVAPDEGSQPDADTTATPDVEDASEAGPEATSDEGANDDGPGPASNALAFQLATGSDGAACEASCAVEVLEGAAVELAVVYEDTSGGPIATAPIQFTLAPGASGVKLSALSAYTDDGGVASVTLTAEDGNAGTVDVTAFAPADPDVGELTFQVTVVPGLHPALTVSADLQDPVDVADFEIRLYRRDPDGPACGEVHPDLPGGPPPPDVTAPLGLEASHTFESLPGLDTDIQQIWTIAITGPPTGVAAAHGCIDNVPITSGATVTLVVPVDGLEFIVPDLYEATSRFDLVSGLEGTAGNVVSLLVGLFTTPGETAILAACDEPSATTLSTVCGYLTSGDQLSLTGAAVATAADAGFFALIEESLGTGVEFTGEELSALLEDVHLWSDHALQSGPTSAFPGATDTPLGLTSEVWHTLGYAWPFGATCAPDDDPCGLVEIPLADVYGADPTASYDAAFGADWEVQFPVHTVPLMTFGPLVNHLIEAEVLPKLFGDGSAGLPPIDSYDDLIATLLGDKYCLLYDDCCEYFSYKVEDDIAPVPAFVAEAACYEAIPAGASWIRDQVLALDAPLTIGSPAGQGCQAHDVDGDRVLGWLGLPGAPCVWDATFQLPSGPFAPANTWLASAPSGSSP